MPLYPRMIAPIIPPVIILCSLFLQKYFQPDNLVKSIFCIVVVILINGPQLYNQTGKAIQNSLDEPKAIAKLIDYVGGTHAKTVLILTSDSRSPSSLLIHFGYQLPEGINIVSVNDFLASNITAAKYFYFENTPRSQFLSRAYGQNVQYLMPFISSDKIVYESNAVQLAELSALDREKIFTRSSIEIEKGD